MFQSQNVVTDTANQGSGPPARPPNRSGSEDGGPAGSPNLDTRTNFDGAGEDRTKVHIIKMLRYPDGSAEVIITRKRAKRDYEAVYIDIETGEILDRPKVERSPLEQVQARHKSVCRSKTKIRRAIQSMGADRMITLTYRENQCDLQLAWQHVAKALRLIRDASGPFSYVVVAERQKRGAWHFHIAGLGFQDLDQWQRAWPHGWIRVDRWKGPLHRMASYMAKYVSKSFSDLNNDAHPHAHRFKRSQGINPDEVQETITIDPRHALEVICGHFRRHGLIGFAHFEGGTRGEINHYVWGCTWLDPP